MGNRKARGVVNTSILPRPDGRHPVHLDVVPIGDVFSPAAGRWMCERNGETFFGGETREAAVRSLLVRAGFPGATTSRAGEGNA